MKENFNGDHVDYKVGNVLGKINNPMTRIDPLIITDQPLGVHTIKTFNQGYKKNLGAIFPQGSIFTR